MIFRCVARPLKLLHPVRYVMDFLFILLDRSLVASARNLGFLQLGINDSNMMPKICHFLVRLSDITGPFDFHSLDQPSCVGLVRDQLLSECLVERLVTIVELGLELVDFKTGLVDLLLGHVVHLVDEQTDVLAIVFQVSELFLPGQVLLVSNGLLHALVLKPPQTGRGVQQLLRLDCQRLFQPF